MRTFEDPFKWEVTISGSGASTISSEREVFSKVSVLLSDVFSQSRILARLVARRTARRSNDNAWFAEMIKKLPQRLDEATNVTAKNPIPWNKSDWFEHDAEASRIAKAELEQSIENVRSSPGGSLKAAR